ncbi:unnamed protein product [Toxocara canis]|uniref:Large ribosomal subunit protein uL13 n=2 Tax=Toxocara canis TaxID=6265 RepID=A0A183UMG4_TOXCA|nr:unnamed protein product [Toxocara canis]
MGLQDKPIVIDGKDHLLGRLASTVAKQLLLGQKIVVVRCEAIAISGNFHRSKLKYMSFLRKRCNVKPARGPYHLRAPSRMFWRTVRGMLPHKTYRGKNALMRLKAFDGIPQPYDRVKRMVHPSSMRHMALKPRRKYCTVGRLAHEVGWQYQDVVAKLEARRKVKSAAFYEHKKAMSKLRLKALEAAKKKAAPFQKIIESYGYEDIIYIQVLYFLRILASKAMVRLTDNIRFVSLGELFTDELDTADDTSFLNRLHEAILSKIDNQSDEAFVMFDNLSLLCDVMRDPSSLVTFLRQLQISVHAKEIHPKLLTIIPQANQETASTTILHYHLGDRSVHIFPPGLARPNL